MTENTALRIDGRLAGLISPLGGVVAGLEQLAPQLTRSADTVARARLGDVGVLGDGSAPGRFGAELDGLGCHDDPDVAARIAVIEALERYSAAVGDERRWLTGSAVDLGPDAIDLTDAARCAESEIAAPGFPLAPWDPRLPLRWARGWSLLDGRDVWVPAVMSHLGVTPRHAAEGFWLQTSSGCAAGETLERALLAACFELIERDAVAIAWLQRLALPRIDLDDSAYRAARGGRPCDRGSGWGAVRSVLQADEDGRRIELFDATLDLGVPTVLAVLRPPPGLGVPPAVGAACSDSGSHAALKALREVTVVRACVWGGRGVGAPELPLVPDEAFGHLRDPDTAAAGGGGVRGEFIGTVGQRLARVVARLARQSRDVAAVELTPVELAGSGVRVVRVLAPSLIPILAHPGVRYLASRRLYEVPRRMGLTVRSEAEVNPWPSPLW